MSPSGRDGVERQSAKALPHHLLLADSEHKGRSTARERISFVNSAAVKLGSGFSCCEYRLVYHFVPKESTANAK